MFNSHALRADVAIFGNGLAILDFIYLVYAGKEGGGSPLMFCNGPVFGAVRAIANSGGKLPYPLAPQAPPGMAR